MKYKKIIRVNNPLFLLGKVIDLFLSFLVTEYIRIVRKVKIGKHSIIYFRCLVVNTSNRRIIIGKNCKIGCSSNRYHAGMAFHTRLLNVGVNSEIVIGDNCRINGVSIHAEGGVFIGNKCVMASGVNIMDSNGHKVYSSDRTIGRDNPKPIRIGNNVWIGVNSIILKGTEIGDNCIVAAGSVVKGIFPDNVIISGNPAVIVKKMDDM